MNVNIQLPQSNAFGGMNPGFGPMGGGFPGAMMPGMGGPGGVSIQIGGAHHAGGCCKKKKSKRSGGLLGGVKDFLRNIGEAIFGEKDDKKCKKSCRNHAHGRPPFGGPMASANVVNFNYNLGF